MSNQSFNKSKLNSNWNIKIVPVAILVILGIALFIGGILYLREYKVGQRFAEYKVSFKTVGTLSLGDPVRVSGVKIGKVTSIDLRDKNVLVNLHVDSKYRIPKDSDFHIRSMGIMGERMVTITLGESNKTISEDSEYVGIYEPGIGEALGSVGHLLVKVDTMMTYIKEIVDSTVGRKTFKTEFNEIVDEVGMITSDLSEIISDNKNKINITMTNVNSIAKKGDKLVGKLDIAVDDVVDKIDTVANNANVLIDDLKGVTSTTQNIVDKVNNGNGLVAKVINDEKLAVDLDTLVNSVDSLVKTIDDEGVKIRFW